MSGFANTTSVSPERTKAEIESVLAKYGATSFISGYDERTAFVAFVANRTLIRFKILLPDRQAREFTHDKNQYKRSEDAAQRFYDQAVRTIWRRLLLCIKAKLESVASKIESFESAFQAHIVLPSGETVGEWLAPQLQEMRETKAMPKMLTAAIPQPPPEADE